MTRLVFYAAIIGTLFLTGGACFAGKTMNLEQCLEAAEKNNPTLLAAKYNIEGAGYDVKAARADFLPSLTSSYSMVDLISENSKGQTDADYLDQVISTFNIKLSQILYAGSRIVNAYQKAKLFEQVAKAQKDLKYLELRYHMETTFFKLMKAKQDIIITKESVARLTESIKFAEAFFKRELIPYADVLAANVDLADAEGQLVMAQNNLDRERVTLFSLMDMPLDLDVEFIEGLNDMTQEDPKFETSMAHAMENRPDIKSLGHQLSITKKEEKIALGRYLPMVRADAGYSVNDRNYDELGVSLVAYDRDQRNNYWSVGIYVTWDIFDWGKSWYGKEKYSIEGKKISALLTDTRNSIDTGIRKAIYSLEEAKKRIAVTVEAMKAANEYYAQEENRLNAGISTVSTLLEAQGRLIRAQGNKARAILDYQLAKSELRLLTGESMD